MRGLLLSVFLLAGCEKGGSTQPSVTPPVQADGGGGTPSTSTLPASSQTPAAPLTEKAPPPPAPASAAATPNPEHLTMRVGYGDAQVSATVEVDRQGIFRLERQDSKVCGSLSADIVGALWKAVDAAAFAPPESGFTKTVQIAGKPAATKDAGATPKARYSLARVVADLTMVPEKEATLQALVPQLQKTIAKAEEQAGDAGACK